MGEGFTLDQALKLVRPACAHGNHAKKMLIQPWLDEQRLVASDTHRMHVALVAGAHGGKLHFGGHDVDKLPDFADVVSRMRDAIVAQVDAVALAALASAFASRPVVLAFRTWWEPDNGPLRTEATISPRAGGGGSVTYRSAPGGGDGPWHTIVLNPKYLKDALLACACAGEECFLLLPHGRRMLGVASSRHAHPGPPDFIAAVMGMADEEPHHA